MTEIFFIAFHFDNELGSPFAIIERPDDIWMCGKKTITQSKNGFGAVDISKDQITLIALFDQDESAIVIEQRKKGRRGIDFNDPLVYQKGKKGLYQLF